MRSGRVILAWLSGSAVDIAACPNLTDVRAGMSAYRRIPDLAQKGGEGRVMTQGRPSLVARFSGCVSKWIDLRTPAVALSNAMGQFYIGANTSGSFVPLVGTEPVEGQ